MQYFGSNAVLIVLRFRVETRPRAWEHRYRLARRRRADQASVLLELLDVVETLVCIELLHRAAVAAVIRGRSVVDEFARFAARREPDPDGVACVLHLRRTFAIAVGDEQLVEDLVRSLAGSETVDRAELGSIGQWVGNETLDRDAQGLAFLAHWVARRFFPGARDPDASDHKTHSFFPLTRPEPFPAVLPILPLASVSLDTPVQIVYEVPLDAVAVAYRAIWPMVKALERLFHGEGAVQLDRMELDEAAYYSRGAHLEAWSEARNAWSGAGRAHGAGMPHDDVVLADLATLQPVTRLRLVAGRLGLIHADEHAHHDL